MGNHVLAKQNYKEAIALEAIFDGGIYIYGLILKYLVRLFGLQ